MGPATEIIPLQAFSWGLDIEVKKGAPKRFDFRYKFTNGKGIRLSDRKTLLKFIKISRPLFGSQFFG